MKLRTKSISLALSCIRQVQSDAVLTHIAGRHADGAVGGVDGWTGVVPLASDRCPRKSRNHDLKPHGERHGEYPDLALGFTIPIALIKATKQSDARAPPSDLYLLQAPLFPYGTSTSRFVMPDIIPDMIYSPTNGVMPYMCSKMYRSCT